MAAENDKGNPFIGPLESLHVNYPQVEIVTEEIIEHTIFDDSGSPMVTLRHGSITGSSATFHGIYNQTGSQEPALEPLIKIIIKEDIDTNLQ